MLLDAGASPDVANKGGLTPLHMAAHGGHIDATSALLAGGASTDAKTPAGQTPLHFAASVKKNEAVIHALLGAGASASAKDSNGRTPRMFASDEGVAQVLASDSRKRDYKEDL